MTTTQRSIALHCVPDDPEHDRLLNAVGEMGSGFHPYPGLGDIVFHAAVDTGTDPDTAAAVLGLTLDVADDASAFIVQPDGNRACYPEECTHGHTPR